MRKQISLFLELPDYQCLVMIAAKKRRSMATLVREWITPHLREFRQNPEMYDVEDNEDANEPTRH